MNILQENKKRNEELLCYYNPMTGEGSLVPRVPFWISKSHKKPVLIPETMAREINVDTPLDEWPGKFEDNLLHFENLRYDHDFEYWAYTLIKIKDKESGIQIPFKLRLPQRLTLAELERMRTNDMPIRMIIVKARQWGGSTLVQFYAMWLQTRHKIGWNSTIVGQVEKQAKGVRAMYENAIKKFNQNVQELSWKPFQGETSWKQIPERNCTISIASMESPDKIRQEDIQIAHLTEVGSWKKTEGKEPKDVVQSILGTIPTKPYSMFVLESTAKGVGNYFHHSWTSAVNGESNLYPMFVPWYIIEIYRLDFEDDKEAKHFHSTLSEYEKFLWEEGASLEGIKWYREKLREYEGDTWRMQSEFPTTANEAFQNTGRRAFSPKYVKNIKTDLCRPKFVGEIFGAATSGEKSIVDVHFEEIPNGKLHVWKKPNDPPVPEGHLMTNRYVVAVDVGGKSEGADPSAIRVFDRYYMKEGGIPEAILTWHGRMDADLVAWKAVQICTWYTIDGVQPLLIIEVNFFDNKEENEGEAYLNTVEKIAPVYKNLFSRTPPEQIRNGIPRKYGFHMNRQTKPEIVLHFNEVLREGLYIEYDARVAAEADSYEDQGNGKYNAVQGQHDDLLIVTMLDSWACYEYMPPVELRPIAKKTTKRVVASPAQF